MQSPISDPHEVAPPPFEALEIAAQNLARALDVAKTALSDQRSPVRNHPERRQWEDKLTAIMPPLPSVLRSIAAIEREIKSASR